MYNINANNLTQYIVKEYGNILSVPVNSCYLRNISPLLQEDYGEANDCTLTSITTVIKYYKPKLKIEDIYNVVESIAKKYFYRGHRGTPTIAMNTIYNKVLQYYKINKRSKNGYIKDLGYNYKGIQNFIKAGRPVLLSLSKDGRNYYANHTVLIIGYYEIGKARMLAIYDNWYKQTSYIDYNKLARVSGINYLT